MDSEAEAQFRDFVSARSRSLLGSAYALTGDPDRAEDLVQSALTKLAGRWRKVNDPDAYVRRILYHDQVSWWRRRARLREEPTAAVPDGAHADSADQVGWRLDLERALSRLGPRQRAVLLLRFYEDLPDREVAALLGCSVGTVRSQTSRGLARLRELSADLGDPLGSNGALPREGAGT